MIYPWQPPVSWQIGLYIRLSRDDGKEESLSVTNQKHILTEYVKNHFGTNFQNFAFYIDDGKTGTDYDRPDFQRMIRDVEEGRINCIICKNLSRAFRNYSDQGYFLENFFPRFHTRFITLGDPEIDTFYNPEGILGLEVPINGLMNDRYAYKTSCDIRRTFDNKRKRGEFIGAFAPYGYRKSSENKNLLVIDSEASQVVKMIYKWFLQGFSKGEISKKLNKMGYLSPSAYKKSKGLKYRNPQMERHDGLWSYSSVNAILNNKMYIGTMVQGKQKVISYKIHSRVSLPPSSWYCVPNMVPPIIDSQTFLAASQLQSLSVRQPPNQRKPHLFSGLLKCADCKKSMTRKPAKKFVYFNCSTYKRKSKSLCTSHSIRLDQLQKTVLSSIQLQISRISQISKLIEDISSIGSSAETNTGPFSALQRRKEELEKNQEFFASLYLDWKEGLISLEQYESVKRRLDTQEKRLKESIDFLTMEENFKSELSSSGKNSAPSTDNPPLDSPPSFLNYFLHHKNIPCLTQPLLLHLIHTIYIHEDKKITIYFKFKKP